MLLPNNNRLKAPAILFVLILLSILSYGQQVEETLSLDNLTEKSVGRVESEVSGIKDLIDKKSTSLLKKMKRHEEKLEKKLAAKDSLAAKQLFAKNKYAELEAKLRVAGNTGNLKEYIPGLDSLKTGSAFIEKYSGKNALNPKVSEKLTGLTKEVSALQDKLQQANEIRKYIKERKQQIKAVFEKHSLGKHLKQMNKEVYYYQQQISEYKSLLKDPKKLQDRILAGVRELPAFKEFMKKHSELAKLFRVPENYGTPESLAGLQTRVGVQAQLQQRFAGTNVNPQQYIGQQVNAAQAEMNRLKEKLKNIPGTSGGSDMEMPDFKPNSQKTKSFWKRVEYGANVQSQRPNGFLPVTSDVALTAGYKLNDKSVVGIGAAYKVGWGKDWKNIKITHEGLGLRSYVDYKIKGGFWLSGGYEMNYNHSFTRIEILRQLDAWQQSGLIGIMKKTKIGKKTNTVQLLWDFLSYRQVPRTPAIVFRVGVKL